LSGRRFGSSKQLPKWVIAKKSKLKTCRAGDLDGSFEVEDSEISFGNFGSFGNQKKG